MKSRLIKFFYLHEPSSSRFNGAEIKLRPDVIIKLEALIAPDPEVVVVPLDYRFCVVFPGGWRLRVYAPVVFIVHFLLYPPYVLMEHPQLVIIWDLPILHEILLLGIEVGFELGGIQATGHVRMHVGVVAAAIVVGVYLEVVFVAFRLNIHILIIN